jgi:hypothetical protein
MHLLIIIQLYHSHLDQSLQSGGFQPSQQVLLAFKFQALEPQFIANLTPTYHLVHQVIQHQLLPKLRA